MAYAAFLASVVAVGVVGSFIPGSDTATTERPDYHYVPYAGDSLGM